VRRRAWPGSRGSSSSRSTTGATPRFARAVRGTAGSSRSRWAQVGDRGIKHRAVRDQREQLAGIARTGAGQGSIFFSSFGELLQQHQVTVEVAAPGDFVLDRNRRERARCWRAGRRDAAGWPASPWATLTSPSITATREPFMPLSTEKTVADDGNQAVGRWKRRGGHDAAWRPGQ